MAYGFFKNGDDGKRTLYYKGHGPWALASRYGFAGSLLGNLKVRLLRSYKKI